MEVVSMQKRRYFGRMPIMVSSFFLLFILCSCSYNTGVTNPIIQPSQPAQTFTRSEDVDQPVGPLEGGITGDMIPDDKTAVKVAQAYIASHLGEKAAKEYPLIDVTYYKKDGVWLVTGSSEDRSKGEIMIFLQQKDGKVHMGMGAN